MVTVVKAVIKYFRQVRKHRGNKNH